ncbi:MAG: hypothetical protein IOD15_05415, partial [Phycisphaerales bacterium]|nr:hypothetical protein [Phycisphaerales bacterium]
TSNAVTTVVSTSMNDAPTIGGAASGQAVNDNATINPFSGLTIGDVDSPAQTLSVSVTLDSAAKGVFTPASLAASGFVDAGAGVYTFSGTAAQATTAIRVLVFDPTDNRVAVGSTEATVFTVSATDTVGGSASNSAATVISTSINDAPTISGEAAGQSVNDNATVNPFSGMTIGDADNPAQTLSVSVTLDNAAKGVFTPASLAASGLADAGGGVYTFSGTAAQATTAVRALVFQPTVNRLAVGQTESTSFSVVVDDAMAAPVSNSVTTVMTTSVNDTPTVSGAQAGQPVTDVSTVAPFTGVTIADADNPGQILSVSVSVDNAAKGVFTAESLAASGFISAGGGVYAFTGVAADVTAAVRGLVFAPTNNRVNPGSVEVTTFNITVGDGLGSTVNSTTTVVVTPVNDAPQLTLPGGVAGQAVDDSATLQPFSGVTISDADSNQPLTLTVSLDDAAKGVFTPASLASSGFVSTGGGSYRFIGTAAQATEAIRALVFNPTDNRVMPGLTETTVFTVSVNDQYAAPVSDNTASVVSTSINDAPTISGAAAAQTVNDNLTIRPFSGMTIADVDHPAQILDVSVTLDNTAKGAFTPESLTSSGFADVGGGVYTFTGTAAQATAAVRALMFNPADNRVAVNQTEITAFTVVVNDGSLTASNTTTTVVSLSINDAPTIIGAASGQPVNDNATIQPFSGMTIGDVDNPAQTLTVTVTLDLAAKGTFTTASLLATGFTATGPASFVFTGTAAAATTAIGGLVFQPTANRVSPGLTETTVMTVQVNDGTGSPSPSTTTTNSATSVVSTSINDAPTVAGATANQTVNDNALIQPFAGFTVGDVDISQPVTVSVTLDSAAKGVFTPASLSASGFVHQGGGVYTFSGTPTQATAAIRTLVFNPSDNRVQVGSTETTTFSVAVNDSIAAIVSNNVTTVVSASVNDAPAITGAVAAQQVNENATITPFASVTIADADVNQTLTLLVTMENSAQGEFTSASLLAGGFVQVSPGVVSFTGTAASATAAIRQLVFAPADNRVAIGSRDTARLVISVNDSVASVQTNNTTTVQSLSINDAPVVGVLTILPGSVQRGSTATLTAGNVADPDNAVQLIEFYRDSNNNGEFDPGIDTLAGTATPVGGVATASVSTTGLATGSVSFFARARDAAGLFGGVTAGTVTITNRMPTVTSVASSTSVVSLPGNALTLTASGAADPDGTIAAVRFYLDDGDGVFTLTGDTLLGQDSSSAGGFTFAVNTASIDAGVRRVFAVAIDNDGDLSNAVSTTFRMNAAPLLALVDSSVTNVARRVAFTLNAAGAVDSDGTVARVEFFRDSNGNQLFDAGVDTLLGSDTTATAGVYSLSVNTTGFAMGPNRFFARSVDNNGRAGEAQSVEVTVSNAAPTITSVAVSTTVVGIPGAALTLTASGAVDSDGAVSEVRFFLDDGNGVFNPAVDMLLGTDSTASSGAYSLAVNTGSISVGNQRVFAVAVDNDGFVSNAATATFRMNAAPTLAGLDASAESVVRRSAFTLTATGAADSDGTVARVEFFRDANGNQIFDPTVDTLLGSDTTATSGAFTFSVNTTGMAVGANRFFARTVDNNGRGSEARSIDVTISNVAPTITSVAASTTVVANPGAALTLTASGAADSDGTVSQVRFFLDDGNGVFNPEVDTLLGSDGTPSSGAYSLAVTTDSIAAGTRRVYAVTVDSDGAMSSEVSTTFRMNAAPTVTSATASATSIQRRTSFVLTGSGAVDTDGTVARVEFYRDSNNSGTLDAADTLLGSDTTATAGAYTFSVSTNTMPAGVNRFFVRAVDNNGGLGAGQAVSVTINNLTPTITSLAVSTAVVANPGPSVTVTASGAADTDGTVAGVQFFLDDGDGTFDASVDTLLGTDSVSSNGFAFAVNTSSMSPGIKRVFARTVDSDGDFSVPVTNTFRVNAAPTLAGFAASASPISRTATFTLTATDPADSDGTISRIEFYRDRGVLGLFEPATDALLGNATLVGGVWRLSLNGSVFSAAGTYTLFARAVDNNGAFSEVRSMVVQVA